MFLDWGKGHGVSKVFKKRKKNFLGRKLKGSITQEKEDVLGHELNGQSPCYVPWELFQMETDNRPRLEYFCCKNIRF